MVVGGLVGELVGVIGVAIFAAMMVGMNFPKTFSKFQELGFNSCVAQLYILLISGFGTSIGIGMIFGLSPYLILSLVATGLPLAVMLLYPPLKRDILIVKYWSREPHLIKP